DILLDRLSPRLVLEKAVGDANEKPVKDIVDAFYRYPHLPMVESDSVVLDALARGVQEGLFGIRIGERTYYNEPVSVNKLEYDAVLVHEPAPPPPPDGKISAEAIAQLLPAEGDLSVRSAFEQLWNQFSGSYANREGFAQAFQVALQEGIQRGLFVVEPGAVGETLNWAILYERGMLKRGKMPPPPPQVYRRYALRATIHSAKASDFFMGVIAQIMRQAGADFRFTVEFAVEGELPRNLVDISISETLKQIGAQVAYEHKE
ncbi:MAG: hypothetical protein RMJ83_10175, partial [Armatimonadota bacterium]|nr:hypothetical protein [Armatimonadota bacterium]